MKNKKKNTIMFLIILILGLTIGFAILTQTLKIDGTGLVKGNSWDIHWANPEVIDGSASDVIPTLSNSNTLATYEIDLYNPGDYYEFTIDAVNAGTLDAEILKIDNNFYNSSDEEIDLPGYLKSTITNIDGTSIEKGQRLNSQESKKYKVRVDYRDDVDSSELPSTDETITGKISIEYIQADVTTDAKSFKDDDWGTISDCAKLGNCPYEVGDTKDIEMDLDDDGTKETYKLRIANLSTPSECKKAGFSQTACGLVLEFEGIIENKKMNPINPATDEVNNYKNPNFNVDTDVIKGEGNQGGWAYSDLRAYLNGTVYQKDNIDYSSTGFINKLPSDLRKVIINTKVVSGYGCLARSGGECVIKDNNGKNFVTTDKIFLFSPREVWNMQESWRIDFDAAYYGTTRQLDYYASVNSAGDSSGPTDGAIKSAAAPGAYDFWFLRTASSDRNSSFFYVFSTGEQGTNYAGSDMGISPAFRVG